MMNGDPASKRLEDDWGSAELPPEDQQEQQQHGGIPIAEDDEDDYYNDNDDNDDIDDIENDYDAERAHGHGHGMAPGNRRGGGGGRSIPRATIERNERILALMEAGSARVSDEPYNSNDNVTDFILHMQQKNRQMQHQQATELSSNSSSSDDDDDVEELDSSSVSNNMAQRRRRHKERSPDEYPPGEAYGYEGDDDDEIPGYDPKDDDLIPAGRICCVVTTLLIGLVAMTLFILLVVVVVADEETSGNHNKYGYVIPSAPSTLNQLCAPEHLESTEGMQDCRDPCREAACCWEKGEENLEPLCWEDNRMDCAPYQVCVNLLTAGQEDHPSRPSNNDPKPRPTTTTTTTNDNNNYIAPAPQTIASCKNVIGSVDQVLLCEDACSHAPCCWKEEGVVENCSDQHANCKSYKDCEILNEGGTSGGSLSSSSSSTTTSNSNSIPTAPSDLAELCSAPAESLQICAGYCSQAECCWKTIAITSSNNSDGTTSTQFIAGTCSTDPACEDFMPCTRLNDEDTSSGTVTIPQAPEGLDFICSTSMEECKQHCNQATCCWETIMVSTSSSGGLSVSENIVGTCSSQPECQDYQPCSVLREDDNDGGSSASDPIFIPTAPSDLAEVCTTATQQCEVYCNEAPCCWEQVTVTSTNPVTGESTTTTAAGACAGQMACEAYFPCNVLQGGSGSSSTGTSIATSSPTDNVVVPPAPDNLDATCSPANPSDVGAMDQCVQDCFKATCCWKTTTITSTSSDGSKITESTTGSCSAQQECRAYSPCSTLENDLFSPHSPGIDTTTAPAAAPGTNAPAPVTSAPPADSSSGTAVYSEQIIFDACYNHVDQPGKESMCAHVCEPGSCCYNTDETCASTFDCGKYEPCNKLVEGSGTSSSSSTGSEVEAACTNTQDLSDCVGLCADGACCFTSDLEKSCDKTAPSTICADYKGCEILYGNQGDGGR